MSSEAMSVGRLEIMDKPSVYVSLLQDLLPLFALAFSIMFAKGIVGLRSGLMGKSVLANFFNIVISSAIGGAFAVGCALLLPLFNMPTDSATMLGVVVFIAIAGVKIVDSLLYKKLGVHFIDASDKSSADAAWVNMSEEERKECIDAWQRNTHEESEDE